MSFVVTQCQNGWMVEVWRDRYRKEVHVFVSKADVFVFLGDLMVD